MNAIPQSAVPASPALALTPPLPQVVSDQRFDAPQTGIAFADTVYVNCHFDRVTWSRCRLSKLRFVDCRFDANRFEQCELQTVVCDDSRFQSTGWQHCALGGLSFSGCEIHDAVWKDCTIKDTICTKTQGTAWTFDTVQAAHLSFVASELAGVHLHGGRWRDSAWIGSRVTGLRADAAQLDNFIVGQSVCTRVALTGCRGVNVRWIDSTIEHMSVQTCALAQAAWSHSRWSAGAIRASRLPLASFDHATLDGVTIEETDLTQALFDSASVTDCDLHGLHAPRISLRAARLARVRLTAADLQGVDARGAQLDEVQLTGAQCRGGRLTGQPPSAWLGADTRDARFEEATTPDELRWWQRIQPGARGV